MAILASLVESGRGSALQSFRALRALRVLRMFRSMRRTLSPVFSALWDASSYLVALLLLSSLFLFIFAALGYLWFPRFGDEPWLEDRVGGPSFRSLLLSILTVLQVMTRDSWTDILARASARDSQSTAVLWCFSVVLIMHFFLFSMLLSIFLRHLRGRDLQVPSPCAPSPPPHLVFSSFCFNKSRTQPRGLDFPFRFAV